MRQPPRRPDAPILSRFILWRVFLVSILFAMGIFGQFTLAQAQGAGLDEARTMAVNTLVAMEVFLPVFSALSARLVDDMARRQRNAGGAFGGRAGRAVASDLHLSAHHAIPIRHSRTWPMAACTMHRSRCHSSGVTGSRQTGGKGLENALQKERIIACQQKRHVLSLVKMFAQRRCCVSLACPPSVQGHGPNDASLLRAPYLPRRPSKACLIAALPN